MSKNVFLTSFRCVYKALLEREKRFAKVCFLILNKLYLNDVK
jgi:hypothetical protein